MFLLMKIAQDRPLAVLLLPAAPGFQPATARLARARQV
jgi:hypothetical protein